MRYAPLLSLIAAARSLLSASEITSTRTPASPAPEARSLTVPKMVTVLICWENSNSGNRSISGRVWRNVFAFIIASPVFMDSGSGSSSGRKDNE